MQRIMCKSKIHGAVITDSNLEYPGSITVDKTLMAASNILPHEKVQVLNLNNGSRLETYVIPGEENTGTICLNGAAARSGMIGDRLIIISYCFLEEKDIPGFIPKLIFVDEKNKIRKKK